MMRQKQDQIEPHEIDIQLGSISFSIRSSNVSLFAEYPYAEESEPMDNPILQSLWDRKSTRVFLEKPIPKEAQEIILGAAMQAPTAGNQMLYTILQITDQNLKERLAETCDHQPFIAKAPLVLVFLADFQRWYDAFVFAGCNPRLPAEGDLMLAVADACIAAQNSVVAAQSLGIGSCYIGDIFGAGRNPSRAVGFARLRDACRNGGLWVSDGPAAKPKETGAFCSGVYCPGEPLSHILCVRTRKMVL
ncbi:MAG: nitroreductase family protein [Anaeromassilibacillus sp.]